MAPPAPTEGGALRSAIQVRDTRALPANKRSKPRDLLDELVRKGTLSVERAASVRRAAVRAELEPTDILINRRLVSAKLIAAARASLAHVQAVDLTEHPPERGLAAVLGAARCIELGVAPWRRMGKKTVVVAPSRAVFEAALPELTAAYGAPQLAIAPRSEITAAVARQNQRTLVTRAESRVAPIDSCRTLGLPNWPQLALLTGAVLAIATLAAPATALGLLTAWALITLFATLLLKVAAAGATLFHRPPPQTDPPYKSLSTRDLPRISVLVALYKETDIAAHLIARLQRLNYPREKLEVLLVTESDDLTTQATLGATHLPFWMQHVTVPPGRVKTKPRALNYALDHCTGDIIGVYDAEDAPEPDQLLTVAARFAQVGEEVACLQGRLDYYNPRANWIARCFALEYAAWFRVLLPGLARLRLPVPLGGTTLFFRRKPLRELGAWDAHNVTEDADLGLRLTRRGYRTELVDTTTYEEANCRAWPWVRQRSRWLKGYAVTYAVHMRNPRALWRDLGPWGFLGVQVLFAGTLSQFLLAPVLLSFWLAIFGLPHAVADFMGPAAMTSLAIAFIGAELINWSVTGLGISRSRHKGLWPWIPALMVYFPMGALAALKAFYELFGKPFFWDKTSHGISQEESLDLISGQPVQVTQLPQTSGASQKPR
ncbi:MAG: glycosyltransferase family 2 protein [Pseudomonadota bacterium]